MHPNENTTTHIRDAHPATGVPLGGELGSVDGNTLAMSFNYRREI